MVCPTLFIVHLNHFLAAAISIQSIIESMTGYKSTLRNTDLGEACVIEHPSISLSVILQTSTQPPEIVAKYKSNVVLFSPIHWNMEIQDFTSRFQFGFNEIFIRQQPQGSDMRGQLKLQWGEHKQGKLSDVQGNGLNPFIVSEQ